MSNRGSVHVCDVEPFIFSQGYEGRGRRSYLLLFKLY